MVQNRMQPNILLIMADQFRFDATGVNGGWVRTPHLDRIATEGVNFTNCFTNSPVCVPARICMATGLYPHNTNVWTNIRYILPDSTPTWTEEIRRVGYKTSVIGKTHLHTHMIDDLRKREQVLKSCGFEVVDEIAGPRASAKVMSHMTERWQELGFLEKYRKDYQDRFATRPHIVRPAALPLEHYADVYVADRTIEYLKSYNQDEPWFCWLSFGGPHEPWDTPEPYASMYDPSSMPKAIGSPPGGTPGENEESSMERQNRPAGHLDVLLGRPNAREEYQSRIAPQGPTYTHCPDFKPGEVEAMRADYAGNVTLIDDQIGRVLDLLEERGELENTVIAFTSDHGEMNGDHGLIYKENFLNGSVRVPLIVRTPETLKNQSLRKTCDGFVEWFDVGPTLVDLAGGQIEYRQFAKSLIPVISGETETHRNEALSEIWGEHMIANEEWKMVINTEGKPYMLFNVADDPDELTNLTGRYPDIENRLRLRILERIAASHLNEG
jgi:choline-sulfatase